jgi:hypothetical protein
MGRFHYKAYGAYASLRERRNYFNYKNNVRRLMKNHVLLNSNESGFITKANSKKKGNL